MQGWETGVLESLLLLFPLPCHHRFMAIHDVDMLEALLQQSFIFAVDRLSQAAVTRFVRFPRSLLISPVCVLRDCAPLVVRLPNNILRVGAHLIC